MKIFTGGGLIGWLAKAREEKIMDEYRKACAREWVDSFNRPRSFGGGSHGWECQFCGKRLKSYSGERTERPSVNWQEDAKIHHMVCIHGLNFNITDK